MFRADLTVNGGAAFAATGKQEGQMVLGRFIGISVLAATVLFLATSEAKVGLEPSDHDAPAHFVAFDGSTIDARERCPLTRTPHVPNSIRQTNAGFEEDCALAVESSQTTTPEQSEKRPDKGVGQ